MSLTPRPRQNSPKQALKDIDKDVETLKNRIRKLEIQQAKTQGTQRLANKKATQLVTRKMVIEQLLPLKHRDTSGEQAELQLRRKQIQQSRAQRQQQVRDVKQALYLMKRQQADMLYQKKQQMRQQVNDNKQQFISSRQERHDHIKESVTHDRYMQFMREKRARAKLSEHVDNLAKQADYEEKKEILRGLEERQKELLEQLQVSHKRSMEAERRYALAYKLPSGKLIPGVLGQQSFVSKNMSTLEPKLTPNRKQPKIHETTSVDRRTKLFPHPKELRDQASFELVLSALRKRHSQSQ